MGLLEDIGAWSSVIGAILGGFAIWITIRIYRKTRRIEEQQRKNAEGLYVTKTQEYLKKIQDHFDKIFKIIENVDLIKEEDKKLATEELNLYFWKNHGEMSKLYENSARSLELWVSLDQGVRDKFDKVISSFDWLITKFFPLQITDEDMRTKIWTTEHKTFLEKKYNVDQILDEELKTET